MNPAAADICLSPNQSLKSQLQVTQSCKQNAWLRWLIVRVVRTCLVTCCSAQHFSKGEHLSHNRQGWHGKIWMGRSTREVELTDRIYYVFPCSPPHTHTHTPRRCHQPQHTRRQLHRRPRISSVSYRTGVSSTRWRVVVFHIDCGITDTKATALSQLPRLWNGHHYVLEESKRRPGTRNTPDISVYIGDTDCLACLVGTRYSDIKALLGRY